jgi:hypothetical protein
MSSERLFISFMPLQFSQKWLISLEYFSDLTQPLKLHEISLIASFLFADIACAPQIQITRFVLVVSDLSV